MSDKRSADLGVKLAEAMDCKQTPGSVAEIDLKIKLTEIMLDHHMQYWLNSKNIKKTDVLDTRMSKIITSIMPIYHAGHWLYESKKGKVSMVCSSSSPICSFAHSFALERLGRCRVAHKKK